jgi:hypothetical protein
MNRNELMKWWLLGAPACGMLIWLVYLIWSVS